MLCFFFVKQKTAYEMRSSDWSSDVCSSDLTANEMVRVLQDIPGAGSVKADQVGVAPTLDVKLNRAEIARYGLTVQDVAATIAAALGGRPSGLLYVGDRRFAIPVRVQIVRASCRVRVCRYVLISVVAVSFNKNTINIHLID